MNYDKLFNEVIFYIEENLTNRIELSDISEQVYISIPHLYRLFSAYNLVSIKKYIRYRRISKSVKLIKSAKHSILDIALSLGFESHEVFIRAFRQVYGISPRNIKKDTKVNLYEAFDVSKYRKQLESEIIKMEVPIILFDEINLKIKQTKLNQKLQCEQNLIPKFIKETKNSLEKKNKIDYSKLYSLYEYDVASLSGDDEDINYTYFVGVECNESIPGFDSITIPSNKYAEFIYNIEDKTLNGIKLSSFKLQDEPIENIYDYIDGIWLLTSGYILSDDMDFEIRDKNKPGLIKYYISIK